MQYKKLLTALFCATITTTALAQKEPSEYWNNVKDRPSTLGVNDGFSTFETTEFKLKLVNASQTIAGLYPTSNPTFDFTTGERIAYRDKDSIYYLGDLTFSLKDANGNYQHYSTAYHRKPVTAVDMPETLAAANLANTLPSNLPLEIIRFYKEENNALVLGFTIRNTTAQPVEIGALGVPMPFNNILEGKTLDETHADNVFFDPYIGLDAGYLEVKKLSGKGQPLLVLPNENMPFEAYRPLNEDPTIRSIVFEGVHEWMPLTKAYAENEWKGVTEWNEATSLVLKPGESKTFSLKLVLASSIEKIQNKLIEEEQPVAVGVPGYVLPMDVDAQLFLNYSEKIKEITVSPSNALTVTKTKKTKSGYQAYKVKGNQWGRAKVVITYKDGKQQSINYKVIKPEANVVDDFGHFLLTEQWFDTPNDIFGRTNSVISYDYETKRQVTQDSRAWVAGLSDEGGAGSWLGAVMKQLVQPEKEEIAQLEQFIDDVVWGGIQYKEGKNKYGVKKSVFFYEPDSLPKGTYSDSINWNTWAAWDIKGANDPGRSYNYPHVAAAYWVMYRLARYHKGYVTHHNWQWYLEQAYHTAVTMPKLAPWYAEFGQMEGTVFLMILKDLKREQQTEMATTLETAMKQRADHWKSLNYPFGSEMPWDSTGQEEVYMWSLYFGYLAKANVTLDAILAYMPTMPHWAYNGNARRYWDFLYGGKLSRVERQIHHYGTGLNAIPVLTGYRLDTDFYKLKVGYGGLLGAISNITEDGFGAAAFHSYPTELRIDYLSGDYGSNFFGYAVNDATYLTHTEVFGWLAFGGNLTEKGNVITVKNTTAAQSRIFIAQEKLWITLDAGTVESFSYNTKNENIELTLSPANSFTKTAYINIEGEDYTINASKENGAYVIPLETDSKVISVKK
ncbi:hypothetical protein SAMN05216480_10650 [Pustulibacterium marinum]|uniref:Uncharacterized protein n=1 Tax=Pustulibacterium marinum TaxID=1224947 RepID=A0A1I7GWK3_9FLAO|nr:DUF5695 domain-containing protein [Pustulibacterium marinum]SFU52834.1 hypothetical protein SAMN05216480_10650 [Pustulibacterium marinum]